MDRCEKRKIERQTDNVFFVKGPLVRVGKEEVAFLKDQVARVTRKTVRLCAHQNLEALVHEMLILHLKETYIRPHKHPNKSVSYHIVEGTADMVIFDEEGGVEDVVSLGAYGTGRRFYFRLNEDRYYMPLLCSDFLLFHETISGPCKPFDTVYAPWAAEEGSGVSVDRFREELMLKVDAFHNSSKRSV